MYVHVCTYMCVYIYMYVHMHVRRHIHVREILLKVMVKAVKSAAHALHEQITTAVYKPVPLLMLCIHTYMYLILYARQTALHGNLADGICTPPQYYLNCIVVS